MFTCYMDIQWIPEVTRNCPSVPFLLVGIKNEQTDGVVVPVPYDGAKVAAELKAVKYVECSVNKRVSISTAQLLPQ